MYVHIYIYIYDYVETHAYHRLELPFGCPPNNSSLTTLLFQAYHIQIVCMHVCGHISNIEYMQMIVLAIAS